MNTPWIESQLTKSDEFGLRIVSLAKQYPSAFLVLPANQEPDSNGNWASYEFDGVVKIWVNTTHPEAIELYENILIEKKEAIMAKELTVVDKKNVYGLLSQNFRGLQSVLPDTAKPEKVMRMAYQVVVKNPDLARKCSPASLINCFLEAASLNLEIGGPLGLLHIVPRKGKAEVWLDYKGEIELMYRSPLVRKIVVNAVYENDNFDWEYGSNQFLKHKPTHGKKGELVFAYCHVFFTNGDDDFVVCDQDMADYAKSKSDAKDSNHSPWNKPGEVHNMWIKTAVHRMAKRIPKSPQLQKAVAIQEAQESNQYDHAIDVEFTNLAEGNIPPGNDEKEPDELTTITPQEGNVVDAEFDEKSDNGSETIELPPGTEKEQAQIKYIIEKFPVEYSQAKKKFPKGSAKEIFNEVNSIIDAMAPNES